jgi:hypothetical protein
MQHYQHFNHLSNAHVILLPKKNEASGMSDYRPISLCLTHSIAKLLSKLLASSLAGSLNDIISRSQSASIKRWCIQDSFLYTQNIIRELHRGKVPALFLKLDIAKAFESARWTTRRRGSNRSRREQQAADGGGTAPKSSRRRGSNRREQQAVEEMDSVP